MVYQYSPVRKTPFINVSPTERYPKIVLGAEIFLIANSEDYLNRPVWISNITPTLEPVEDLSMTIGIDYSTLVVELPNGENMVVSKQVPAPYLTYTGNMSFSFTSAYMTPTKIYRLQTLPGYSPPREDFSLAAEVDPVMIPGASAEFTDFRSVTFPTYSYHYFVANDNGASNIVTLTGTHSSFSRER